MLFVKACHNAFLYVLLLCETDNLFIYVFPCFNTDGVVYIWKNHNIFFSRVFMKFNICTYFIAFVSPFEFVFKVFSILCFFIIFYFYFPFIGLIIDFL